VSNPYPTLPACVRSTLRWYDGSSLYGSRMFWTYQTPPASVAALNSLATAIATNWHTQMGPLTASSIALVEVDTEDLNSRTGNNGAWQGTLSGSNAGYEPPANASMNVRFLITDHYRGGHPYMHHPPPPAQKLQNSRTWDPATCSSAAAAFTAMVAAINTAQSSFLIPQSHVVPRHWRPGGSSANVTFSYPYAYAVPTHVGSIRSRLTSVV
jgi:hypothetical protein